VLVTAALWVAREDAQQQTAQAPTARNPEIIRIQRPEHADLVLERDNNTWQITAPCALLVNQQRLSPLLEALNTPAASYSAAEVDTEAAGLDAPLATLVLDDESIIIGGVDVSGARRYVQSADRVELVPEWILSLVGGGLSAFASNDVFAGKVTQVLIAERALDVDAVGAWNGLVAPELNAMQGATVSAVRRRAKYLLLDVPAGTAIVHLGMSGSLRIVTSDEPLRKHDHVELLAKAQGGHQGADHECGGGRRCRQHLRE